MIAVPPLELALVSRLLFQLHLLLRRLMSPAGFGVLPPLVLLVGDGLLGLGGSSLDLHPQARDLGLPVLQVLVEPTKVAGDLLPLPLGRRSLAQ